MARTKIDNFTSAESWTILPRKMVRGLDRVCCEIPWLLRNFGDRGFAYPHEGGFLGENHVQ